MYCHKNNGTIGPVRKPVSIDKQKINNNTHSGSRKLSVGSRAGEQASSFPGRVS